MEVIIVIAIIVAVVLVAGQLVAQNPAPCIGAVALVVLLSLLPRIIRAVREANHAAEIRRIDEKAQGARLLAEAHELVARTERENAAGARRAGYSSLDPVERSRLRTALDQRLSAAIARESALEGQIASAEDERLRETGREMSELESRGIPGHIAYQTAQGHNRQSDYGIDRVELQLKEVRLEMEEVRGDLAALQA